MKIMILGATGLTGTAITQAAVARGHEVIAVHRGHSAARGITLPSSVEPIILDRLEEGHEQLSRLQYDAVIDVSGYAPAVVSDALRHLYRDDVHWCFISTVSVNADKSKLHQSEDVPLLEIEDAPTRAEAAEDPSFDWRELGMYGECKVLCEREVEEDTDDTATILRPCVIAGAHDSTWRFSYWVDRFSRPGPILMPEPRTAPIAIVDVRDLAEFAIHSCEQRLNGPYVIAPDPSVTTFEALAIAGCQVFARPASDVVWVGEDALIAAGVEPWAGLPFWLPTSSNQQGVNSFNASRARIDGFNTRSLADTMASVAESLENEYEQEFRVPDLILDPELEATLTARA